MKYVVGISREHHANVCLLKDGKVISNWHIHQLPDAKELITLFDLNK